MAETSGVDWLYDPRTRIQGGSWNFFDGCDKVSEGCRFCYIGSTPALFYRARKWEGEGLQAGIPLEFYPERLMLPFGWSPRRIFVNSLGDLFHADVPRWMVAKAFAVMALTPEHTYIILTKRPGPMRAILNSPAFWVLVGRSARQLAAELSEQARPPAVFSTTLADGTNLGDGVAWEKPRPLANVIGGVSVEDQDTAELRIPSLLSTEGLAYRAISAEPLLGPIDLYGRVQHLRGTPHRPRLLYALGDQGEPYFPPGDPANDPWPGAGLSGPITTRPTLDWVIVGGESGGRNTRPMHPDWARSLVQQAEGAGVATFYKQHGVWPWFSEPGDPWHERPTAAWVNRATGDVVRGKAAPEPLTDDWQPVRYWRDKKRVGHVLDGAEHLGFPSMPRLVTA